jgi:hypothetical protein
MRTYNVDGEALPIPIVAYALRYHWICEIYDHSLGEEEGNIRISANATAMPISPGAHVAMANNALQTRKAVIAEYLEDLGSDADNVSEWRIQQAILKANDIFSDQWAQEHRRRYSANRFWSVADSPGFSHCVTAKAHQLTDAWEANDGIKLPTVGELVVQELDLIYAMSLRGLQIVVG